MGQTGFLNVPIQLMTVPKLPPDPETRRDILEAALGRVGDLQPIFESCPLHGKLKNCGSPLLRAILHQAASL